MKRIACVAGLVVALASAAEARASYPMGVFALVERVAIEPNEQTPERIQIWGAFALAEDLTGNRYAPPARGYLYYRCSDSATDRCGAEWADLKQMAGTGKWVAFESTEHLGARVRKANEKPVSPDTYYADNLGVQNVGGRPPRYVNKKAVLNLLALPAPVSPAEGDLVPPGKVTLVTGNILSKEHAKASYVFELTSASGDKEVSPSVAAGGRETKWTPKTSVKAGGKYTWSVRATDGAWHGPAARSSFVVKGRP